MRDAGLGLISVVWGLTALYIAGAETQRKAKQQVFSLLRNKIGQTISPRSYHVNSKKPILVV
jgi:hypothetical protein